MSSSRASGFNGILAHPEFAMSVVLPSGGPSRVQRDFASSRDWRFRLAFCDGSALTPRA